MPTKQDYNQAWWGNTQAHIPTTYRLASAAVGSSVSVAEVKDNLRITWSTEDTLLGSYISIAESIVQEDVADVVLLTSTHVLTLDEFPSEILIERLPVTAVAAVKYYDLDNTLQTLETSKYFVDLNSFPARIWSAVDLAASSGVSRFWPDVKQRPGAVQVEFTAGYANAAAVPDTLKQLVHLWVSHLYNNRAPVEQGRPSKVPYTIEYATDLVRKRRLG